MDWFKWARGFAVRTWGGELPNQERLAEALYEAARDMDAGKAGKLIEAGALGTHKGWAGRDPLIAAMSECSEHAERMALVLMKVCDPSGADSNGRTALMASIGEPSIQRARPLNHSGNENPWCPAFWTLLDWSDLSQGRGFAALHVACRAGWDKAAQALSDRLDWSEQEAYVSKALASALEFAPELAMDWASRGLGASKNWSEASMASESVKAQAQKALALRESVDLNREVALASESSDAHRL